ncbi:sugar kinase [Marinomonas agarivorans]|nr:sugar kinase [Marinomonas agarivorans]
MSEQEDKVLSTVKKHPLASQQTLATLLAMSRESVAGHIMRLMQKGHILGKGYLFPSQTNIVVIGGCNLDIAGTYEQAPLYGDSNPGKVGKSAGGVGRNIAENLARLAHQTTLISALGMDESGEWLFEYNKQLGINMTHCLRSPKHDTGTYLAINQPNGELQYAVADMAIFKEVNKPLLTQKQALLRSADLLIIEANIHSSSIEWLAKQTLPLPICADAVSASKAQQLLPLLPKLTLLKVNRQEAIALLERTSSHNKSLNNEQLAQALVKLGIENVLLSLGSEGVLFANHQHCIHQTAFQVTSISDTGAGDALFAGFIHGYLEEWPIEKTLKFACACAAKTLTCQAANDPTLNAMAINQWIANH